MSVDPIDGAIAEAERRRALSERDLSDSVDHFVESVRAICDEWALAVDAWLAGGVGPPTLAVTTTDGTAAVLKIAQPGSQDAAARVMSAADGHGYARVLAWEASRGALLIERLGGDLWASTPALARQLPVIGPLLSDAWQVPLECGAAIEGKAADLLSILARLGPRYGSQHRGVLARATSYAAQLAATERREVVCHGDPHAGNVLRRGSGWALIDPDGFVGERCYDLGVVVRDGCREIVAAEADERGSGTRLLREGCHQLADLAGVDAERVWRWGFVERVTTGLYLAWHGHLSEAATFLDAAAIVADD